MRHNFRITDVARSLLKLGLTRNFCRLILGSVLLLHSLHAQEVVPVFSPLPQSFYLSFSTQVDSFLYIAGGADANWNYMKHFIRVNIHTAQVQQLPDMPIGRYNGALLRIADSLYVIGGRSQSLWNGGPDTICVFNLTSLQWVRLIPVKNVGFEWDDGYNVFTVLNDTIYGITTGRIDQTLRVFKSSDGINWVSYNGPIQTSQEPVVRSHAGKIYILGGDYGQAPNTFTEFNPSNNQFKVLSSHPIIGRGYLNTVFSWGDTLFQVNGGIDSLMALYLPSTGKWTTRRTPLRADNAYKYVILYPPTTFALARLPNFNPVWDSRFFPPSVAPDLVSPKDSNVNIPTTTSLVWRAVNDADRYRVELYISNPIIDTVITDTTLTIAGLDTSTMYFWRVTARNPGGYGPQSPQRFFVTASVPTSISQQSALGTKYSLSQNYPNPFNPATQIVYELPRESRVLLEIYNILGEKVATLVDQLEQAGRHRVWWNPETIPSGVYFYRLQTGSFIETKKLLLLR